MSPPRRHKSSRDPPTSWLAATAPATAEAGAATTLTWTVTNQGTGDTVATDWTDKIVRQPVPNTGRRRVLLSRVRHHGALNADASYTTTAQVVIPSTLVGSYYLFVVTDAPITTDEDGFLFAPLTGPDGAVYEGSNANDNTSAAVPVAIERHPLDLLITQISIPSTAQTGGVLTVDWSVRNTGEVVTNVNYWYDDVFLSTDPFLGAGDIYLGGKLRSGELNPGATYNATADFTLPSDLPATSYYVIVRADRPASPALNVGFVNRVSETNETNNDRATATTVSVSAAANPDLAISGVDGPSTAASGRQISVQWTVTNTGSAAASAPGLTASIYRSINRSIKRRLGGEALGNWNPF